MECDTKVYTLFSELHSLTMNESKFIIYGHDESKQMNECLSYIAETAEDATAGSCRYGTNEAADGVRLATAAAGC